MQIDRECFQSARIRKFPRRGQEAGESPPIGEGAALAWQRRPPCEGGEPLLETLTQSMNESRPGPRYGLSTFRRQRFGGCLYTGGIKTLRWGGLAGQGAH
jgi:hypothetical protein